MWKVVEVDRTRQKTSPNPQVRIRLWHIATLLIASSILLTIREPPTNAFFMKDLENQLANVIQRSTSVSQAITYQHLLSSSFNGMRCVFITLLTSIAIYSVLNQATPRTKHTEKETTAKQVTGENQ